MERIDESAASTEKLAASYSVKAIAPISFSFFLGSLWMVVMYQLSKIDPLTTIKLYSVGCCVSHGHDVQE